MLIKNNAIPTLCSCSSTGGFFAVSARLFLFLFIYLFIYFISEVTYNTHLQIHTHIIHNGPLYYIIIVLVCNVLAGESS